MDRVRTIILVLAAAAVLWWLYPGLDAGDVHKRTEITVWFNGTIEGRHLAVVDAFERRYPQYRVILGSSATRGGLEGEANPQRLMCGVAGGVPPEVVEYDRFAVCQWAARKAFLDLNSLIAADRERLQELKAQLGAVSGRQGDTETRRQGDEGSTFPLSPSPLVSLSDLRAQIEQLEKYQVRPEDYYPQTWNECAYQGGQYGIPNYMDTRVLYYNSDLLVQNGLSDEQGEPRPPETWEQVCRKRVDVEDATVAPIDSHRVKITSAGSDFLAAGVAKGDSLSHISATGVVTRCLVDSVISAHELVAASPYSAKDLVLPARSGQHVKIFDQNSYALKLSRWDNTGRMKVVGFEPHHGNGWLYMYGWMAGGEFLSPDGSVATLDDPRIAVGLQWTVDVYDALGGVRDVNAFKQSFQADAQDPFFRGQIGMFINGDWFLRDLARFAQNLHFGAAPAPVPAERLHRPSAASSAETGPAGRGDAETRRRGDAETVFPASPGPRVSGSSRKPGRYFTWVAGFSYCIPATCPPEKREAAWTFVKYLSSVEGGMVMNEHDAQREHGQGRLYMPRLVASKPLNEKQFATYMHVPGMPQRVQEAMKLHIALLPYGRFRPVSPEGQKLWNAQAESQDIAWNHKMTPRDTLTFESRQVQAALDRFYHPTPGQRVSWRPLIGVYLAGLVAAAAIIYLRHRRRYRDMPGYMRREWYAGVLFSLPWLLGFIVLSGGPMLFSAVLSFTHYDVLSDAVFVGTQNYSEMLDPAADPLFFKSLGNTLFMAIGVPLGMIVGLGLAMLLDTRVRGMSVYRTMFFLPAIMPAVAASILWIWVFNAQNGLLNWMLQFTGIEHVIDWLGLRFDIGLKTPIGWLTNEQTSKPALIIMGLWGCGASMIIWLAGLQEVPTHLYEAAALDGAGPIRRFRHVTLPMLTPYILFNLVMGLIGTFQVFTQAYIMTPNGSPSRSTYFYVYKLFDECFSYFRLGYGAAMAWVLFLIVIVLTLFNLVTSKKWVYYAGD